MSDLVEAVEAAEAADAVLAMVRMRRDLASRLLMAGCTEYVELLFGRACLDGYFTARHLRIIADAIERAAPAVEPAGNAGRLRALVEQWATEDENEPAVELPAIEPLQL